jgi:lipid II:glycine glycyltransferase (peptidoglycan interpeptide bridge formation enzyme)
MTAGAQVSITNDQSTAPEDWDARAVQVPGGHVLQSSIWAEYRARGPDEMHFLTFDDGAVALAGLRRSRGLPGSEAVVRRGPVHRDDPANQTVARAVAVAEWARSQGARDLFMDPEIDLGTDYGEAMAAAGFVIAEEREPSIHVMRLVLQPGTDEDSLFASLSKSTRQRIRAARDAGIRVRESSDRERLRTFAELLRERADVLGIALQQGDGYLAGWSMLIDAGLARLLLAEHDGELVGGLLLLRQGGIHATALSADKAERRNDLPGTMHLVRWVAVSDALAEGCGAIELGGVDLPGHRERPQKGDPHRGLYEHKRGFGAEWVEREPARRIVLRPTADALARARRQMVDGMRGMRT